MSEEREYSSSIYGMTVTDRYDEQQLAFHVEALQEEKMNLDILQELRNKGWKGKTLALRMGVCGDGKIRRVDRYDSVDPVAIKAQCDAMQKIGIAGVVHIWNGPSSKHGHQSMMACWAECEARGMSFAIMLDQWIAKGQHNPTATVIAALGNPDFRKVLNSKVYLPEWYLLEFNLAQAAGVNIAAVQLAVPKIKILSAKTGYSWINPNVVDLAKQNVNPLMKIPGVCMYFNDGGYPLPNGVSTPQALYTGRDWSKSVWGMHGTDDSIRVTEHQGGNWYSDQIAVTPISSSYVMFATLDDHEEGTGIEYFGAALAGVRI